MQTLLKTALASIVYESTGRLAPVIRYGFRDREVVVETTHGVYVLAAAGIRTLGGLVKTGKPQPYPGPIVAIAREVVRRLCKAIITTPDDWKRFADSIQGTGKQGYGHMLSQVQEKYDAIHSSLGKPSTSHAKPPSLHDVWAGYAYSTGSSAFNNPRRGLPTAAQFKNLSPDTVGRINQQMDHSLSLIKPQQGTFYRGEAYDNLSPEDHRQKYTPGKVIQLPGFTSTSRDREAAAKFMQGGSLRGRPLQALYTVQSAAGRQIQPYSRYQAEGEYLFPHNQQFHVASNEAFKGNPYVRHITLQDPTVPKLPPNLRSR
ncbi:MAG: hypothetical protein DDT26_00772 [Dehalococcoidia bacterium]|nr:hypothetical protein [Chloroflexota bacterium]